jgi:site-specific recombinase XerC
VHALNLWEPTKGTAESLPVMRRGTPKMSHRRGESQDKQADPRHRRRDAPGIPGGTARRLRHWYGTNLVASGADLRTTQTLTRHANLANTAIYTQVADEARVDAIDGLDLR